MIDIKEIKKTFNYNARISSGVSLNMGFSDLIEEKYYKGKSREELGWNCQRYLNAEYSHRTFLRKANYYFGIMIICAVLALSIALLEFFGFALMWYIEATTNTIAVLLLVTSVYCSFKYWDNHIYRYTYLVLCNYHLYRINKLLGENRFVETRKPHLYIPEVSELLSKNSLSIQPTEEEFNKLWDGYIKHLEELHAK